MSLLRDKRARERNCRMKYDLRCRMMSHQYNHWLRVLKDKQPKISLMNRQRILSLEDEIYGMRLTLDWVVERLLMIEYHTDLPPVQDVHAGGA